MVWSDREEQSGADQYNDGGGEVDPESHGFRPAVAKDYQSVGERDEWHADHEPRLGTGAREGKEGKADQPEGAVPEPLDRRAGGGVAARAGRDAVAGRGCPPRPERRAARAALGARGTGSARCAQDASSTRHGQHEVRGARCWKR
ncbi:hypothetical protein GCM10014715_77270 [Streptomyces spiralis]|uniref:Uncharacterized protein n=1 Tax=Streptomyces spiralis TaxID=66376 RepID=A0A919AHM3_9ACTN|nr:hypothetical protein GCM10014715_77270 [Streptomyces spiralis]